MQLSSNNIRYQIFPDRPFNNSVIRQSSIEAVDLPNLVKSSEYFPADIPNIGHNILISGNKKNNYLLTKKTLNYMQFAPGGSIHGLF